MVAALPVPQHELKKLAEANIVLSEVAQDLLQMTEQISDPPLRNRLEEAISKIIRVAQTVEATSRAAVYSSTSSSSFSRF